MHILFPFDDVIMIWFSTNQFDSVAPQKELNMYVQNFSEEA